MKRLALSIGICLGVAGNAWAQSPAPDAQGPRAPIRDPYITSTGATVPKSGQSQSGGTTTEDRKIQREDNKIDSDICKGC